MIKLHFQSNPISVNALYRSGKNNRRYLTPEGIMFKTQMATEVIMQCKQPLDDISYVHIMLSKEIKGDIDNYAKAILDVLTSCGIIKDDRYLSRLFIERAELPLNIRFQLALGNDDDPITEYKDY